MSRATDDPDTFLALLAILAVVATVMWWTGILDADDAPTRQPLPPPNYVHPEEEP